MQKKLFFIILLVFFVFHSCLDYSLPKEIQLEAEGSVNLPIRTVNSMWTAALIKSLGDKFPEGMEIYNVNYGQEIQSFCMYIPIGITYSLNPRDYLDGIADLTKEKIQIEKSVDIPSFNFTITCPVSFSFSSLSGSLSPGDTIVVPYPDGIPLSIDKIFPMDTGSEAFLHALIKEGNFDMRLDLSEGGVTLAQGYTETYDIRINQDPDNTGSPSYKGLAYSNSGSVLKPLDTQEINKEDIDVKGTITLKSDTGNFTVTKKSGGNYNLEGHLTIKMNIKKFATMDIDLNKVTFPSIPSSSISLASAKYLNWIEFDNCYDALGKPKINEKGEPASGIGINMNFTKFVNGLKMSIGCNELSIKKEDVKTLQKSNNIFGNTVPLRGDPATGGNRLQLNNPAKVSALTFDITLSRGSGDVLQLGGDGDDIEAGKPLKIIDGEAELFAIWTAAEVDMEKVVKGKPGEEGSLDKYGEFPKKSDDGGYNYIDLSMINNYIDGFEFMPGDVTAMVYLSGPNGTLDPEKIKEPPSLKIEARYLYNEGTKDFDGKLPILKRGPPPDYEEKLVLEKNHVILKDNPAFLDKTGEGVIGSYRFPTLPAGGNKIYEFEDILNTRPEDLFFQYSVGLPAILDVEPDMFIKDGAHDIAVAVIVKINFIMVAKKDPSRIILPDMFKDQKDLLGRDAPDENSMLTSVNVDHLNFAIDLAGTFFTGGKIFLEKNIKPDPLQGIEGSTPVLFPLGIPVNGSKIGINITNSELDIIRSHLIDPDLRLEFAPGAAITIPRNMGLISVTVEAKGKNTLTLDF